MRHCSSPPKAAGRAKGAQGVLAFWDRAYRALAQYRLEHDDAPKAAALGAADGRLTADFGAGRRICSPCFLKLTKARWKL